MGLVCCPVQFEDSMRDTGLSMNYDGISKSMGTGG